MVRSRPLDSFAVRASPTPFENTNPGHGKVSAIRCQSEILLSLREVLQFLPAGPNAIDLVIVILLKGSAAVTAENLVSQERGTVWKIRFSLLAVSFTQATFCRPFPTNCDLEPDYLEEIKSLASLLAFAIGELDNDV